MALFRYVRLEPVMSSVVKLSEDPMLRMPRCWRTS